MPSSPTSFHRRLPVARGMAAGALILVLLPGSLPAQAADYRLGAPRASLGVHGGWLLTRGGGDLFDFTRRQLTVESRDLDAFLLRGEAAFAAHPRVDVTLGVGWSGAQTRSEFRDWVDEDRRPIEQTNRFVRLPLTAGGRIYLTERGRSLSRFAWIPAPWTAHLSAGGGVSWYRFQQWGDFVDAGTLDIFEDDFRTDGWGPTAYLGAGGDYTLSVRSFVTLEARYHWGWAGVGRDYQGFDRIDLSGLHLSLGISIR